MDILSFLSCYFPSFGHVQVLSEFWQGPSTLDLINTHRESSTDPKRNYWNVYEANLYSQFHQSHISLVCAKVNVTHWIPAASPCSGVYYQHYEIPNQSSWGISPVNKSNNVFLVRISNLSNLCTAWFYFRDGEIKSQERHWLHKSTQQLNGLRLD